MGRRGALASLLLVLGPALSVQAAPLTGDSYLVVRNNAIREVAPDGSLRRLISVPRLGDFNEVARDLSVGADGRVYVFNGTFSPSLSIYNPATSSWQHLTVPGWSIGNGALYGGIATHGGAVFVADQITALSADYGVIRIDPATGGSVRFGAVQPADITIGHDGWLYTLDTNTHDIDVFDPVTLAHVHELSATARSGIPNALALAVAASGDLFVGGNNVVYHLDPAGALLNSLAIPCPSVFCSIADIDLKRDDTMLVSMYTHDVFVTDASLAIARPITVPTPSGVSPASFVAFAQYESPPSPPAAPTATITRTPSSTRTPTMTRTITPTRSRTPTTTPSASATDTVLPTAVDTWTVTETPSPTETWSATVTPTPTATDTETHTATATSTDTPSESPTATSSPSATPSDAASPTPTAAPTSAPSATIGAAASCAATPRGDCRAAGGSQLIVRQAASERGDRIKWIWRNGPATDTASLGDQTTTTSYALCLYAIDGATPRLLLFAEAPAGGMCGGRPCWRRRSGRVVYVDRALDPDGLYRIRITTEGDGGAALKIDGRGERLRMPSLPLDGTPEIVAQVITSDQAAGCWEDRYAADQLHLSDGRHRTLTARR